MLLSARLHEPSGDEQEPASAAFCLGMLLGHDEADKQSPQAVDHEQKPGGEFGGRPGLGTEVTEASSGF